MDHEVQKISVPVTVDITTVYGLRWLVWNALFLGAGVLAGSFIGYGWRGHQAPPLAPQVQSLSEEKAKLQGDLEKSQQQVQELQKRLQDSQDWTIHESHVLPRRK